VVDILDAANVTVKEITISYDPATRAIQVSVASDFQILSRGVLDPIIGSFELRAATSMRYEG
jgi:hypothetical protein